MKLVVFSLLLAAVVIVASDHTFLGTNVQRPLLIHTKIKHDSKIFQKRVEFFNYTVPVSPYVRYGIQGILAYDLLDSGATANVTEGGIGANFVKLRMKSDKGKSLKYDIYIYA